MNERRSLSEKSVRVLGLIAEGYSYEQIVGSHSDISYRDIFQAAEEALCLNESPSGYQKHLAQIKSQYPKAYEPWTAADDIELASMHEDGKGLRLMAEHFQRQPSAIRSRLAKLNLSQQDERIYLNEERRLAKWYKKKGE